MLLVPEPCYIYFMLVLACLCLRTVQILAMQSAELPLATSGEGAAAVVGIWEGGTWEVAWDSHVAGVAPLFLVKEEVHFFAVILCC